MGKRGSSSSNRLGLKAGEWVEVRTRDEILATLDERGYLDSLPFMPEMLQYCGQRLRVSKRADKTCDNIIGWSIRRMNDSVHLENIRCDGNGHGGCQAGCLVFWKEAWLKRAEEGVISAPGVRSAARAVGGGLCTVDDVRAASQSSAPDGETVYKCQATELRRFTSSMRWWDPRQYVRDWRSGNLMSFPPTDSGAQQVFITLLKLLRIFDAMVISAFEQVQLRRCRTTHPLFFGTLERTPCETLDLESGELVQVRTKEEIIATLDKDNRNRGLLFDVEMLRYCCGIYRVLRRVHHIIDEKTGKMMNMKHPCIILEGVACQSDYHRFCPREIYHYWRETWLKRVSNCKASSVSQQSFETCERC